MVFMKGSKPNADAPALPYRSDLCRKVRRVITVERSG
jgi:hypothetical protein